MSKEAEVDYAKESRFYAPISVANILEKGLLHNQINGYKTFIQNLPYIITNQFAQAKSVKYGKNGVATFDYGFSFHNIKFSKVVALIDGKNIPVTPGYCRNKRDTYCINLFADIKGYQFLTYTDGTKTEKVEFTLPNIKLGSLPCPVKSEQCAIVDKDSLSCIRMEEDPTDPGGYYIIDGSEKAIIATKSVIKNAPQFYLQNGKDSIDVKCDFTSQLGDNFDLSHYIVIQLMTDGSLVIRIDINRSITLFLPFQVLYKIFNIGTHKEIANMILPNYNHENRRDVLISAELRKALKISYADNNKDFATKNMFNLYFDESGEMIDDPIELTLRLAEVINEIDTGVTSDKYNTNRNNNDAKRDTVTKILAKLDNIIFPHIGVTPESRINKLKYLGFLINGIYGVKFGDEPSNRNSLANQVISTTAMTLIMSFKSLFNITVVSKIIFDIQKAITSTENPRNINIHNFIESGITDGLMKAICEAIKAGNKSKIKVNKQSTSNRVITNVLERTNKMATVTVLRSLQNTKAIGGKTNDAVTASRNNHPTSSGVNCQIKSVEGASAGLIAELALSVEFSDIIYSDDIRKTILEDPDAESIDKIDIMGSGINTYSRVILNGNPICSHYDTKTFADKLRRLRRQGIIDRNTSIIFHPLKSGDLEINTQKGRALRPFVVVYNNYEDFKANHEKVKFRQWVKFTVAHSDAMTKRQMKLIDLIDQGIVEMISPIEYKNIYVAHSIEHFNTLIDDPTHRFTHVDLPLSNFGMSVLACPYINHSATVRTAYEGNQRKQTLGIPIFNYYSAFYGKLSVAFNAFEPVAETIVNRLIRTDGAPMIVSIMSGGNNQEDSLIVSENLTELGRFSINYYTSTNAILETNQCLEVPSANTLEVKSTDYSHLKGGIPIPGSVIRKGMPIIGIIEKDGKDSSIKRDRSIVYKKNTPVIVDSFNKSHDSKGYRTISVKLHSVRHVESGDKFSSRAGGKAIISKVENIERMPISASGVVPCAQLNPHAFPSRMIANQMMSGTREKLCTHLGVRMDCTVFSDPNERELHAMLKTLKMENCTEVMYDDVTGERIHNKIFLVVTFYQRLSKMIKDQSSAVDRPTTDVRTQQTTRGINNSGGSKLGEMEKDTLITNGALEMVYGKMFKDCDKKILHICNNCGNSAAVNPKYNIYKCIKCAKEQIQTTFTEVASSFATFNLLANLAIMGIGTNMVATSAAF
jgi:DNA-directed RNA polymerase subunit B